MIYSSLEFARKAVELRLDLLNDVSPAIAPAEQKTAAVNCRQLLHSRLTSVDSMKNWPFICCFYCWNLCGFSDLGKSTFGVDGEAPTVAAREENFGTGICGKIGVAASSLRSGSGICGVDLWFDL